MGNSSARTRRLADAQQRRQSKRLQRGRPDGLPLGLELIAARGHQRGELSLRGHIVHSRKILLAVTPMLRTHLTLGLRTLRLEAVPIHDRAELFARSADRPIPLVLGDLFDGVAAERLLAMMRTTGWSPPVVVIGAGLGPLPVLAPMLAPVAVVRDPIFDSSPITNPWLRRCIEAVMVSPPCRDRKSADTVIGTPWPAA